MVVTFVHPGQALMAKLRAHESSTPRAAARKPSPRHRTDPDPLAEKVGHRIRALRHEAAFAFDAFVEATGLGRGYISELERGLVIPTIGVLARVADALEITMADLVLGDTARELLFGELRGQAKTFVEELRGHVRERERRATAVSKPRKSRR